MLFLIMKQWAPLQKQWFTHMFLVFFKMTVGQLKISRITKNILVKTYQNSQLVYSLTWDIWSQRKGNSLKGSCRAVVLNFGCTSELPGELLKIPVPRMHHRSNKSESPGGWVGPSRQYFLKFPRWFPCAPKAANHCFQGKFLNFQKSYNILGEMIAYWHLIAKEWEWKTPYSLSDAQSFSLACLLIVWCVLQILYCRAYGHQAGTADEGRTPGESGGKGTGGDRKASAPKSSRHSAPTWRCLGSCSSAGARVLDFSKETGNRNFLNVK